MDKDFIKFTELVLQKSIPEYMTELVKFLDKIEGKRLIFGGRKGPRWIKDD